MTERDGRRGDAAAQSLGIEVVDVGAGRATLRMTVAPTMLNGHGDVPRRPRVHPRRHRLGPRLQQPRPATVAAAASIDFLAPANQGAVLVAEAIEQHRRGRTGLYDVVVTADDGTVVARFHGRSHEPSPIQSSTSCRSSTCWLAGTRIDRVRRTAGALPRRRRTTMRGRGGSRRRRRPPEPDTSAIGA